MTLQELEQSTEPLPYKLWPGMGGCPDPHIPIKAENYQLFEQMHNDDRWGHNSDKPVLWFLSPFWLLEAGTLAAGGASLPSWLLFCCLPSHSPTLW